MFCGLPVTASLAECGEIDAVIVTELAKPEEVYRAIAARDGNERIFAPQLLQIALPTNLEIDFLRRAAE